MTTLTTAAPCPPRRCDAVRYSQRNLSHLDERSIALARNWAVSKATAWGAHPAGVANLKLVTSELVANAYLHTGPSRDAQLLLIHQEDGAVCVEVRDCGREDGACPVVRHSTESLAESGRGLALVAALSYEWGVDQIVPGHSTLGHAVWAHPQDAYAPVFAVPAS